MPDPTPRSSGKPSLAERLDRARAAATPRLERAAADAAPKVEKAAQAAGGLLGTLRDRARETVKQFSEGYAATEEQTPPTARPAEEPPARPRPRPRPGPGGTR